MDSWLSGAFSTKKTVSAVCLVLSRTGTLPKSFMTRYAVHISVIAMSNLKSHLKVAYVNKPAVRRFVSFFRPDCPGTRSLEETVALVEG